MIDTLKHILPLLSRCKSELMGFSILLIMAFHTAGGVGIPLWRYRSEVLLGTFCYGMLFFNG